VSNTTKFARALAKIRSDPARAKRIKTLDPDWIRWVNGRHPRQVDTDKHILGILKRNSLNNVSIDEIKMVCASAYENFFKELREKHKWQHLHILSTGNFYDFENKKWCSQRPMTAEEMGRVRDYISTLILSDPGWEYLQQTSFDLHCLTDTMKKFPLKKILSRKDLHKKIVSKKAPPITCPEKEWAQADRYLQANLSHYLIPRVDNPAIPRSKKNPGLAEAAKATHEIMMCFGVESTIKGIKDSYHEFIKRSDKERLIS